MTKVNKTSKSNKKVARKTDSKSNIMKKLKDPKTSPSERARLTEKLYDGIEFRKKKVVKKGKK